jgi:hypothetical protein
MFSNKKQSNKTEETDDLFAEIFRNKNNSIDKSNIYKLLEKDALVKAHIDENPEKNNFYTYILTYKYESRNSADKFLHNVPDLFAWYKTKNPDFKPLSQLPDLQMPEFATLLLTIAMNVMKVLIEKKYPGSRHKNKVTKTSLNTLKSYYTNNNSSAKYLNKPLRLTRKNNKNNNKRIENDNKEFLKLKSILGDINDETKLNVNNPRLPNYFSYKAITEIYLKFIVYMSGNFKIQNFNLDEINQNYNGKMEFKCECYIDYVKRIYNYTPFIIFPTFNQLNELIVLKTMSAPVINFLITYSRFLSHNDYLSPCNHIEHDLWFHGEKTHLQIYEFIDENKKYFNRMKKQYILINDSFADYTNANKINKLYSNIMSKFFKKAISSLSRDHKDTKGFFLIFHEYHLGLEGLINKYNNNINFQKYLAEYENNTELYEKILTDYNNIIFENFGKVSDESEKKLVEYIENNPYPLTTGNKSFQLTDTHSSNSSNSNNSNNSSNSNNNNNKKSNRKINYSKIQKHAVQITNV